MSRWACNACAFKAPSTRQARVHVLAQASGPGVPHLCFEHGTPAETARARGRWVYAEGGTTHIGRWPPRREAP